MIGRGRRLIPTLLLAVGGLLLTAAPAWALEDPLKEVGDSSFFRIHGVNVLTKFMVIEVLAGLAMFAIFIPLARAMANDGLPRGRWQTLWASLLEFIRDEVARPTIGEEADEFVPFLWTQFIFILFCNLFGMVPIVGGSPTASIWVTGALALCSFLAIYAAAIGHMGLVKFLKVTVWPPMEIPAMFGFGWLIKLMIAFIEVVGLWMKSAVLAIRLFANMLAGHIVLFIVLSFTVLALNLGLALWGTISALSVTAVIGLSFLELFVACLQAYVFVFLTSLFIGAAMHPH